MIVEHYKMEVTLSCNGEQATAIIPEDSVIAMLSTHTDVVEDPYIITILRILNGTINYIDLDWEELFYITI